jgi:hypothetical protein
MAIKILTKVTGVRNPAEHEIPKKALAVEKAHVSKFADKKLKHAVENVLEDTANCMLQLLVRKLAHVRLLHRQCLLGDLMFSRIPHPCDFGEDLDCHCQEHGG